jgi:hypothetical protein
MKKPFYFFLIKFWFLKWIRETHQGNEAFLLENILKFCVLLWFIRLRFIDMLITLGKCNNVLFYLWKQVGVVRIVLIVLNLLDMIQDSKVKDLWTRRLFFRLQSR